jgi:hypothetical protein
MIDYFFTATDARTDRPIKIRYSSVAAARTRSAEDGLIELRVAGEWIPVYGEVSEEWTDGWTVR